MNKILIDKETVVLKNVTKSINIDIVPRTSPFGYLNITIDVIKDSDIELDFNMLDSKINVLINCEPNIRFNIYEIKHGNNSKTQYKINLNENSTLYLEKINYSCDSKESTIVSLNGENSSIYFNLRGFAIDKQVCDLAISHNSKNTSSTINNNALSIDDGKIYFQLFEYVDTGITGCVLNNNDYIINLSSNKCQVNPCLYISEKDTIVNNNAVIDITNDKDNISRYLLKDIKHKKIQREINKNIKKYWR